MSAVLTDGEIIAAARRDPARFADIFDRHWPRIHRYCVSRAGVAAGEDVAAETFRVALDGVRRFDRTREDAAPWLFGIATNLLRHGARSEGRRRRALARIRPGSDDDHAERSLDRVAAAALGPQLAAALQSLTPASRDTLLLHVWAELSYEQIAQAMCVAPGTVRSRISRAREQLRAALDPAESLR